MIVWLNLHVEGDPQPRRFDSPDTVRQYVLRVERLSEDAADALVRDGEVGPPLARRRYTLQRLNP